MGFEILPMNYGDIDEVDPIFDIFEIISYSCWIPSCYRHANQTRILQDIAIWAPLNNVTIPDSCKSITLKLLDLSDLFGESLAMNRVTV